MDADNAKRLLRTIPDRAKVIDVGGGAAPFPRANFVIDAVSYAGRGFGSDGDIHKVINEPARYTEDSWIQVDLCARRPWPFPDKYFDFAICSHLLEDVRDPIWICSELGRVAKAGYIETPSRVVEQSKGVENPRHAGYHHHRWLVSLSGQGLIFRHKPHVLHSSTDAIVTCLGPGRHINPRYAVVALEWTKEVQAEELLEFDEQAVIIELAAFASAARRLPELTLATERSLKERLRRRLFYLRLWLGQAGR